MTEEFERVIAEREKRDGGFHTILFYYSFQIRSSACNQRRESLGSENMGRMEYFHSLAHGGVKFGFDPGCRETRKLT